MYQDTIFYVSIPALLTAQRRSLASDGSRKADEAERRNVDGAEKLHLERLEVVL